jgi:hypothetical protein
MLVDDLLDKSGKACPVAAFLSDDDRATLATNNADSARPAEPISK